MRSTIQANEFGNLFHGIHSETLPTSVHEASVGLRFKPLLEEAFLRFFVLRTHRLVFFTTALFCIFMVLDIATSFFQQVQLGLLGLPLKICLVATTLLLAWWITQQMQPQQARFRFATLLAPPLMLIPIIASLILLVDAAHTNTAAHITVGTAGLFYTTFLATLAIRLRIAGRMPFFVLVGLVILPVLLQTGALLSPVIDLHAISVVLFGVISCGVVEYDKRNDFITLAQIYRIATTDPLSRTLNRRAFFERGQMEIDRARRYNGSLALLMLDIDHFKEINDRFGHLVGDQVIASLSDLCRDSLRSSDLFGRIGGEEFAIVLPDTDLTAATMVSERLRVAIENQIETSSGTLRVTISLGTVQLRQNERLLQELIGRADVCLYAAKRSGRNRVVTEITLPGEPLAERTVGAPLTILTT
jgi:diguanylate cyclase (GGDEF)-like protein